MNARRTQLIQLALKFTKLGSEMPLRIHSQAASHSAALRCSGTRMPDGGALRMSAPHHHVKTCIPLSANCHTSGVRRDIRKHAQLSEHAEAQGLRPRPMQKPAPPRLKDVPVTSNVAVLNKYLAPGKLMEFRLLDDFVLAVVLSHVKQEGQPSGHAVYEVMDSQGNTHHVKPSQVVVVLPGKGYTGDDVKKIASQAAEAPDSMLVDLWERLLEEAVVSTKGRTLASDPQNHHDVLELSKRMWGSSSADHLYATHKMLREDEVYFYRLKTRPPTFHVRSKSEVERLRRQKELEAEQAEQRRVVTEALQAAVQAPKTAQEWTDGPHYEAIAMIDSFARGQTGAPHGTALCALLDLKLPATPDGAAQLLKQVGYWPAHLPNTLIRGKLNQEFPEYLEDLCSQVVAAVGEGKDPKDGLERTEYTAAPALAIDDSTTLDVDDAVSVEARTGGGWRVAVHVADPAAYVGAGDPLDLEALERGRTLYLPWGKIPMFPFGLSDGVFSLSGDNWRNCITFYASLAADGSLEEYDVKAHRVKCVRKTYDEVDDLLRTAPEASDADTRVHESVQRLHAASKAREQLRFKAGCAPIVNMNCILHVKNVESENPDINLRAVAVHESDSRTAVMEMMVLAGEVAAKWASSKGVPVLYRYQEAPSPPTPKQLERLANSKLAQSYLWRTRMLKSGTTAELPRRHHGLGIDAYCQVTSPIRRYTDLMCHYQIKAALRGKEAPYTAACLERTSKRFDDIMRRHRNIESEAINHFLAIYCSHKPGHLYEAEVLGIQKDGAAVLQITEIGLERTIMLSRPTFPGRKVSLRAVPDLMAGTVAWQDAR